MAPFNALPHAAGGQEPLSRLKPNIQGAGPQSVQAVPIADLNRPHPVFLSILGVYLLLAYSRAIELVHAPGFLLLLGLVLVSYIFLTNRWAAIVSYKPTVLLLILTAIMVPSALLGMWPGGSVKLVVNVWIRSVLVYVAITAFAQDMKTFRYVVAVMAFATMLIGLMAFVLGVSQEGRMAISAETLGNPNDLATFLLVGLPFAACYAMDRQRNKFGRFIAGLSIPACLLTVLRTGSRGGMLALVMLGCVLLWVVRGKARAALVLLGLMCALAGIVLLPAEVKLRYRTLFSRELEQNVETRQLEYATGSRMMRWRLFVLSLRTTLYHPLFGVGPGNFSEAAAELTREAGQRAVWQQTHNAFTQVSSECGIPAGILYVWLAGSALRASYRILKSGRAAAHLRGYTPLGLCLFASMAAWIVSATFSSIAYMMHFVVLLGAITAAQKLLEKDLAQVAPPARPAPAPRWVSSIRQ